MSIQAMGWVLERSRSAGSDRLVLLAIANHADAQGMVAWPKVDLIAVEASVSRRTVFRSLENLVALDELEITSGKGRGAVNTYYIKGVTVTPLSTDKGDTGGTPGVPLVAHRTVIEPSVKNLREKGATLTPFPKTPDGVRTDTEYDPDTLVMDDKGRWFVR